MAWEMHGFCHQVFHSIRKVSKTHRIGKTWETGSHNFSIKWKGFSIRFSSCGILHDMGNAWVFSSISHSMGKGRKTHEMGKACKIGSYGNPAKPIVCGEPGKLVFILFPELGSFLPIRFTSYGTLYNMQNTWVSSPVSHSMRKCSEIHRIGRAWETGTHFFP